MTVLLSLRGWCATLTPCRPFCARKHRTRCGSPRVRFARDDHRAERALLRRLCVFASGFVLPAAEAVGEEGKCIDVVDLPDRLVQKSLFDFDAEAEADRCRVR